MVLATAIVGAVNRIVASITEANRRKAEREIARVLKRTGRYDHPVGRTIRSNRP